VLAHRCGKRPTALASWQDSLERRSRRESPNAAWRRSACLEPRGVPRAPTCPHASLGRNMPQATVCGPATQLDLRCELRLNVMDLASGISIEPLREWDCSDAGPLDPRTNPRQQPSCIPVPTRPA
jgi:hypothetical protein